MSHEQMRAFCERVGMAAPELRAAIPRQAEPLPSTERADGEVPRTDTAGPTRRTGGRPRKPRYREFEPPVTRGYVAKVLDVDVSTVRRLEDSGKLHPSVGLHGIRYFKMSEVVALKDRRRRAARSRTVEMRIAAFEMFRDGADWRDVAIKLCEDPLAIRQLWRAYCLKDPA